MKRSKALKLTAIALLILLLSASIIGCGPGEEEVRDSAGIWLADLNSR